MKMPTTLKLLLEVTDGTKTSYIYDAKNPLFSAK